jgi:hypothetical protein
MAGPFKSRPASFSREVRVHPTPHGPFHRDPLGAVFYGPCAFPVDCAFDNGKTSSGRHSAACPAIPERRPDERPLGKATDVLLQFAPFGFERMTLFALEDDRLRVSVSRSRRTACCRRRTPDARRPGRTAPAGGRRDPLAIVGHGVRRRLRLLAKDQGLEFSTNSESPRGVPGWKLHRKVLVTVRC